MSDEFDATLDRIDPQPAGSTARFTWEARRGAWQWPGPACGSPRAPFAAASHRGGTLTVVSDCLPATDPALAYDSDNSGTRHRLRRSGRFAPVRWRGGAHARPRPGHEAAAPGRRRHDVHVHAPPGNPLLQRHAGAGVRLPARHPAPAQLRAGRIPGYYEGMLGAQRASQHPKRCDLSAGIITDDTAGTVTFRLAQADPDFLYKLALPPSPRPRPAPPTTPSAARRSCPAPART